MDVMSTPKINLTTEAFPDFSTEHGVPLVLQEGHRVAPGCKYSLICP